MHVLNPSNVAAVAGGAKYEPVTDPLDLVDRPVPIWRPVFTTDP